jgi:carbamoyl-phosphate synthase large subunit
MSASPLAVLVTCAGSMPGVAVINALKRQDELPLRVIAADASPLSAGFHLADDAALVPHSSDERFIPTVLDVCRREGVQLVYPIIDEELPVFARHRDQFTAAGIRVLVNKREVVETARDKYQTYQFCRREGILVPETFLSGALPAELPFPLIIKPRDARGSVGVQKVRDRRELEFFLGRVANPLVQQYLEGVEYTIDVLTDFDGRVLSLVPKVRLETKAGMQTKGRTVKDPRLLDYGRATALRFGLTPLGNIQCMDSGGTLWLIEVNPKFPASLPFTVAAGVNSPLLLAKMHLGRAVEPMIGQFRDGLVMLRYWQEVFVEAPPPAARAGSGRLHASGPDRTPLVRRMPP